MKKKTWLQVLLILYPGQYIKILLWRKSKKESLNSLEMARELLKHCIISLPRSELLTARKCSLESWHDTDKVMTGFIELCPSHTAFFKTF